MGDPRLNTRARGTIVRGGNLILWIYVTAFLRVGPVVGVVILADGCQQKYWYQEGKTFDQCKADHADCQTELGRRAHLRHRSSYSYRFLANCMQQKGYRRVAEKDLPLEARREDPAVPSDVPWYHAYGVAGAIPPRRPSILAEDGSVESAALVPQNRDQVRTAFLDG
jgi:hypothetical protein